MRFLAVAAAVWFTGCNQRWEPTQADRATAEEREAYRRQVDQPFWKEAATQRHVPAGQPIVWTREGRKVREAAPNRLVPYAPKLPERRTIVRIEYANGSDPYWVAGTAAEIDRIYHCVLRESSVLVEPETARYFFPDGSSFEAPLVKDFFSHACSMGLTFYGEEDLVYEVSCHPRSVDLELRHSREGHIRNPALNAIIQDYCRRSPKYVEQHPND